MRPLVLPANQPRQRFYRGGRRIAEFRGLTAHEEYTPEDWVASVTSVFGQSPLGLTTLEDGSTLAQALAADPLPWLGPDHFAAHGADPLLLVKLLDAGQRLPIHAHPDDGFARTHLGRAHGKAEAWYILDPGTVWVGLTQPVPPAELLRLISARETTAMLEAMHRVDVEPGDTVFVPPGTLHAIGEGTFLMEVQQPEDLSILVEWSGFAIDGSVDGHLGIGFDAAVRAIDTDALPSADLDELVVRSAAAGPTLSERSRPYFRLDLAPTGSVHDAGFTVAVAHRGPVAVRGAEGEERLAAGSTALIPHAFGDFTVTEGELLLAKPPRL